MRISVDASNTIIMTTYYNCNHNMNGFRVASSLYGTTTSPTEARGSSGRANAPSGSLAIPISTPSQVNLGEEFHGDQVLSCRSVCGAFFLALAHRAFPSWHKSLTLAFCSSPHRPRFPGSRTSDRVKLETPTDHPSKSKAEKIWDALPWLRGS